MADKYIAERNLFYLTLFRRHETALAFSILFCTLPFVTFTIFLAPFAIFFIELIRAPRLDSKQEAQVRLIFEVPRSVFLRQSRVSDYYVFSIPFFTTVFITGRALENIDQPNEQATLRHELGHCGQWDAAVIFWLIVSCLIILPMGVFLISMPPLFGSSQDCQGNIRIEAMLPDVFVNRFPTIMAVILISLFVSYFCAKRLIKWLGAMEWFKATDVYKIGRLYVGIIIDLIVYGMLISIVFIALLPIMKFFLVCFHDYSSVPIEGGGRYDAFYFMKTALMLTVVLSITATAHVIIRRREYLADTRAALSDPEGYGHFLRGLGERNWKPQNLWTKMHNMMMHSSWKSRSALQNLGLAVDGFVLFIKSLIWSFLCMVCIGYGLFGINL